MKKSFCSAQIALSFIVLDCFSITHLSRSLCEVIMARFKYFKKVEHTILESAQVSGLKRVEDNDE